MLDRLTSMSAFVRAADSGSLAAAARALGLSPQMVAKHVSSLENRLGTRLLNRTTRSQSLTEAGRVYYERCRSVLAEVEAADALSLDVKGEPRGRLRITAPLLFGRTQLMPMVGTFLQRHRDVEIDVVLTDRIVDLVDEGFEAAFRIGDLTDSTMIARKLVPMSYVVCASPAYLAVRGVPSSPAELATHDCLSYASRIRPTDAVWSLSRDGRIEQVRVTGRLHVNETQALLSAALNGIGILRAPEPVVREALASGQLLRVLPDYTSPALPLSLLYPADRRQTPKLKRFIEESVREFG